MIKKFNWCGFEKKFISAGFLRPSLNGKNYCSYFPQKGSKYEKSKEYELMEFANNNKEYIKFCYFVLEKKVQRIKISEANKPNIPEVLLPKKPGVYIWVIDGKNEYVGKANKNLNSRFKQGYGKITARNCYRNIKKGNSGQSTNLKMNKLVIDCWENNKRIEIKYMVCKNAEECKRVEAKLIDANISILKYNKRHERPLNN